MENPSPQSPLLQPAQDEAALREGLELGEGVRRLGRMMGLKSINRNMAAEDAMVKRSFEVGAKLYSDGTMSERPGDDVDAMAARDITINHNYPANPMQPVTPPVTEPPKTNTLADLAKKAALIAAMGGSGAGGAWLYQYLNKPTPPVIPDIAQPDFNLLPPDPAPGVTK